MKVEEVITQRIMEQLERGVIPWQRPWSGGEMPKNLVTKKEYKGINTFMLAAAGFSSPFWMSFKQVKELGGSVLKGSKGFPVVFWKQLDVKPKGSETDDGETPQGSRKTIPLLRYYTVFNVDQTEGIDPKKIPALIARTYNDLEKNKQCEGIIKNMPKRPGIVHAEPRAYYRPSSDVVNMPRFETFTSSEYYYSTLFHELTHSTGHESRLNRKGVSGSDGQWSAFGSTPYAKEELVAEMGAAFLCGHCQIENKTIDNSAAYIQSWLGKLRNDPKMVIVAAAQAQRASDFIRDQITE
jgi:antirestriction protein ArdC